MTLPQFESFKGLYISNFVQSWAEIFHDVWTKTLDVLDPDELEHLEDGGVEEVVPVVVGDEGVNHGDEQLALDDVSVVELIPKVDDLSHESDGTQFQKCVSRFY